MHPPFRRVKIIPNCAKLDTGSIFWEDGLCFQGAWGTGRETASLWFAEIPVGWQEGLGGGQSPWAYEDRVRWGIRLELVVGGACQRHGSTGFFWRVT